jgi:hypothetical protein
MLLYDREQKEGCPLQGTVLVGRAEELVEVAFPKYSPFVVVLVVCIPPTRSVSVELVVFVVLEVLEALVSPDSVV